MEQKQIGIAVIGGSGLIGPRHCQFVNDCKDAKFVAIVDPSPTATEIAKRFSVPLYSSVTELLTSKDKPDAAIVCTPNHTHVLLSLELVKAGIHVLCEKPISTDLDSARQLIKEAEVHQVKLLIGHHRRFNPYVVATKRLVDSDVIGAVTAVSGLWTAFKPASYFEGDTVKWRSDKQKGGGTILINFIHEIDILQYLLGPVVRIHAEKTLTRRSAAADAVDEGAALTLRFASGVVGTFVICDNVASPHNFESGTGENPMIPKSGADVYRIFGTMGTLSFPDLRLSTFGNTEPSWASVLTTQDQVVDDADTPPLRSQLEHFVRVCRNEEEPRCSGVDGLRALAVCEAIRKALEGAGGGGTVEVDTI